MSNIPPHVHKMRYTPEAQVKHSTEVTKFEQRQIHETIRRWKVLYSPSTKPNNSLQLYNKVMTSPPRPAQPPLSPSDIFRILRDLQERKHGKHSNNPLALSDLTEVIIIGSCFNVGMWFACFIALRALVAALLLKSSEHQCLLLCFLKPMLANMNCNTNTMHPYVFRYSVTSSHCFCKWIFICMNNLLSSTFLVLRKLVRRRSKFLYLVLWSCTANLVALLITLLHEITDSLN